MDTAAQQSQRDELIGRVLNDRFRMISVIARGGMGRVYRAEQVPLGRIVAVKTLDPRGSSGSENDPHFQQRFFLEASVASKLQHPNTVTVFDYGRTADGVFFIAMELVEGQSLLRVIREAGKLGADRTVHIGLQIARSLREAHRFDVIHRDLKPGNVLLTRHGDESDFVKVLDFGLVKLVESDAQELTKAGLFMGSPKYMSPEQIRGDHVDARCDIYALGACMYEMLTGKVPFDHENTVKILMAQLHETAKPIRDPAVPAGVGDLVLRCLSKSAADRPSSMDELILLLKQASGSPMLMSGQFPLSQEIRLSGTSSLAGQRTLTGTPSQSCLTGTYPNAGGTPSAGLHQHALTPTAQSLHAAPAATPAVPSMPLPSAPSAIPQQPEVPAPVVAPAENWLPRAVAIGALLIAAGFLALRVSERAMSARSPAKIAKPPVAAVMPPPPSEPIVTQIQTDPEPAEVQAHAVVRVTSTPAGATLSIDGRPYGTTPADIELWGEAAELGKEIRFHFEKDGYEPTTVSRIVRGEQLAVDAMLAHNAPSQSGRTPRMREGPSAAHQAPVVIQENFKEDPY